MLGILDGSLLDYSGLPSCKTGVMFAVSQSLGSSPAFSDRVNITVRTGATCAGQSLRIWPDISSGPVAFLTSIDSKSVSTPSREKNMSGILVTGTIRHVCEVLIAENRLELII